MRNPKERGKRNTRRWFPPTGQKTERDSLKLYRKPKMWLLFYDCITGLSGIFRRGPVRVIPQGARASVCGSEDGAFRGTGSRRFGLHITTGPPPPPAFFNFLLRFSIPAVFCVGTRKVGILRKECDIWAAEAPWSEKRGN